MSANILNIGSADDDGTGDRFRWAFRKLNQGAAVVSRTDDVPAVPVAYNFYIVPASATGTWAGQDGNMAWYDPDATAWEFYTPYEGVRVWVQDTQEMVVYKSSVWDNSAIGGGGGGTTVYIDPTNTFDMGSGNPSSSAYAAKGSVFTLSEDSIVTRVDFPNGLSGYSVRLMIAEVDATNPHAIVAITYEGSAQASVTGINSFSMSQGVPLDSTKAYAFMIIRTGDTDTSPVQASFPTGAGAVDPAGIFTGVSSIRVALESPVVTDTVYFADYSSSSVNMVIHSVDSALENVLGQDAPDILLVTASQDLLLTDEGDIVEIDSSAAAVDLAIEQESVIAYPDGFIVGFTVFDAANAITVTADILVKLNGVLGGSTTLTATAYKGASLYKRGTDDWVIQGNIGVVA